MSAAAHLSWNDAIHASAVLVGESAILLRGRSGAGKSALALALIAAARSRGHFARLVADDRVVLSNIGGRVIVAPHPAIAGRVERRFAGIDVMPHEEEAVARFVVDLIDPAEATGPQAPVRLPDDRQATAIIAGARLPRLVLPAGHAGAVETILDRFAPI